MLSEAEVLDILQDVGAFRTGHFVYTSGRHGDAYILKDAVYAHPRETSKICLTMAEHFADTPVDAVIGPAIGAAILSQWTAYHLSDLKKKDIYGVYADKDGAGGFIIKRGYDRLIAGKNVLVVEDLTTTGGSVKKVVEAVRAAGATVVGVVVLCNRGNVTGDMIGNPATFISLVTVELESWDESDCELCSSGIPVNTDVGHGKDFLARKKEGGQTI